MSQFRVLPTLREAVHLCATTGKLSMKGLSGELDWAPSELSMRTTLGGDSSRPFPLDDGRLVTMMRAQNDFSPLATLADLCGFELQPKKERVAEMVQELQRDLANFVPRVQMLLEIPGFKYEGGEKPPKGKSR